MTSVGYLVSDCGRRLRRLFDQRVRDLGVTGPQARLLLLVDRDPGRPQSFYAAELDIEPITLTRMLDRMEDAGLIERCPDPDDRRARLIRYTANGGTHLAEMKAIVDRFNDEMLSVFTAEERAILQNSVEKLSERVIEMSAAQEDDNG